ncbi:MAG TPA: hypothetical protein VL945_01345 [Candidatus Saccharimonadales bacterium]|nr:hypothetical protein [Candidatus Saccharimonadales bacterium]
MASKFREYRSDVAETTRKAVHGVLNEAMDYVMHPRVRHALFERRYELLTRRTMRGLSSLAEEMERTSEYLSNTSFSSMPDVKRAQSLLGQYTSYIDNRGSDKLQDYIKDLLEDVGKEIARKLNSGKGLNKANKYMIDQIIRDRVSGILGDDAFEENARAIAGLGDNAKTLGKMISKMGGLIYPHLHDVETLEKDVKADTKTVRRMLSRMDLAAEVRGRIGNRRCNSLKDQIDRFLVASALLDLNHAVQSKLKLRVGDQIGKAAEAAKEYHNAYEQKSLRTRSRASPLATTSTTPIIDFLSDADKLMKLTSQALEHASTHEVLDKISIRRINAKNVKLFTIYNTISGYLSQQQRDQMEIVLEQINKNVEGIATSLNLNSSVVPLGDMKTDALRSAFTNSADRSGFEAAINKAARGSIYEFFDYHTKMRVNVSEMIKRLAELKEINSGQPPQAYGPATAPAILPI